VPPTVILDPEVTLPTPQRLWLSTGFRALDHGIEGFLSSGEHPVVDTLALEGISRLVELLPRSKEAPDDVETRIQLQLAAWMAYFAPLNTPMGLPHALGRRLGASYGIPHGITSCLTLAPTLEVVDGQPPERWSRLSEALGGEPAESVVSLVDELGLTSRLQDFGVTEGDLEEVTAKFGEGEREALSILRRAY
jgi:alcohol dehydrogenase class IV